MAMIFKSKLTQEVLDMYWKAVEHYLIDDFINAVSYIIMFRTEKWFPLPAEIREAIASLPHDPASEDRQLEEHTGIVLDNNQPEDRHRIKLIMRWATRRGKAGLPIEGPVAENDKDKYIDDHWDDDIKQIPLFPKGEG